MNEWLLYETARLFHEERLRASERNARYLEARKAAFRPSDATRAQRFLLLRLLPGRPSEA